MVKNGSTVVLGYVSLTLEPLDVCAIHNENYKVYVLRVGIGFLLTLIPAQHINLLVHEYAPATQFE